MASVVVESMPKIRWNEVSFFHIRYTNHVLELHPICNYTHTQSVFSSNSRIHIFQFTAHFLDYSLMHCNPQCTKGTCSYAITTAKTAIQGR